MKIETIEKAVEVIEEKTTYFVHMYEDRGWFLEGGPLELHFSLDEIEDDPSRAPEYLIPIHYATDDEIIEFARKCQLKAFW